jgi:hypothetical protein
VISNRGSVLIKEVSDLSIVRRHSADSPVLTPPWAMALATRYNGGDRVPAHIQVEIGHPLRPTIKDSGLRVP